ncbi:co-chaperone YbbN [Aquimarina sp. AU474]|uniref:thioredoxin family protein n=1 Tax=Aquimarina sp. AU474 TaxID=2108529 RepID=UPI000D6980AD|nr:thioredoxin family protein [Aquimarina sp. AU474]
MNFKSKIIDFQNTAEKDFEKNKNIVTTFKFLLALLLFFGSTIFAAFTLPFRFVLKQFVQKDKNFKIHKGNNSNIDQLLKEELVLIDFWAEWCGPCVMMNSIIKDFAETSKGIKVVKVNADLNMETLKKFNVRGLPHFLLVENGKEIKRFAGAMTLHDLNKFCFDGK